MTNLSNIQGLKNIPLTVNSKPITEGTSNIDVDTLIADETKSIYNEIRSSSGTITKHKLVDFRDDIKEDGSTTHLNGITKELSISKIINNTWKITDFPKNWNVKTIMRRDGIWLAGDDRQGVWRWINGNSWSLGNVTSGTTAICYGNGFFISNGKNGGSYCIFKSHYDGGTNTLSWSSHLINFFPNTIKFANNVFLTADNKRIYNSVDGETWTQIGLCNVPNPKLCYANNIWIACDGNPNSNLGIQLSKDGGATWTNTNQTTGNFYDVHYANGVWLALEKSNIYKSIDGNTWTAIQNSPINCKAIHYANGLWLAGGQNGLFYSVDNGDSWEPIYLDDTVTNPIEIGAIWYADGFWMVGTNYKGIYKSNVFSYNNPHWEAQQNKTLCDNIKNKINKVNNILESIL